MKSTFFHLYGYAYLERGASRTDLFTCHIALGRVGNNMWLLVQILSVLLAIDAALRR